MKVIGKKNETINFQLRSKTFIFSIQLTFYQFFSEKINNDVIKMWPPPSAILSVTIIQTIFFFIQVGNRNIWSYE